MPQIFTKKNSNMLCYIWDSYNLTKIKDKGLFNQTKKFFNEISPVQKKEFQESSKKVVQFGCSDGKFISSLSNSRKIIGYDYSSVSMSYLHKTNMERRFIDLNETKSDAELAYEANLIQDLAEPADILCIRILEYLNPDSMNLLLFALITHSKSGSIIYLEMSANPYENDENENSAKLGFHRDLKPGLIASFFAPRMDFKTVSRNVCIKNEGQSDARVEQFIVTKL